MKWLKPSHQPHRDFVLNTGSHGPDENDILFLEIVSDPHDSLTCSSQKLMMQEMSSCFSFSRVLVKYMYNKTLAPFFMGIRDSLLVIHVSSCLGCFVWNRCSLTWSDISLWNKVRMQRS